MQHSLVTQELLARYEHERRRERLSARHRFQEADNGTRYSMVWKLVRRKQTEPQLKDPQPVTR